MKKILLIITLLAVLFSFAACGEGLPQGTTSSEETTSGSLTAKPSFPSVSVDDPVTCIEVSRVLPDGSYHKISVYDWEEGTVWVEYSGEEKKATAMDAAICHNLALAVEDSGAKELNGTHTFEEGAESFSMYITFESGTTLAASYSGSAMPKNFTSVYVNLENSLKELMTEVPLYVPRPRVNGTPDKSAQAEIESIVSASEIPYPDGYIISDLPLDDTFSGITGLESCEGIQNATDLSPMMSPNPFQMIIVTLEDGADTESVTEDFMDNIAWGKWVCVCADGALTAQKGNMVIFLLAGQSSFDTFSAAIENCGWTVTETTVRPMPK